MVKQGKDSVMVIEIGCGNNPININTPDIETRNVDYRLDAVKLSPVSVVGLTINIPFKDNSIDIIVSQHVIEHHTHCSFGDKPTYGTLLLFLKEVYRVLKDGGHYETMCPNFAYIAKSYCMNGFGNTGAALQLMQWAMGGQRDKWDHHGVLLDFNIITFYAELAGFKQIGLLHPFDWFGLHVKMEK